MFANWDWVSFIVGVVVTIIVGGGGALLVFLIGEDL